MIANKHWFQAGTFLFPSMTALQAKGWAERLHAQNCNTREIILNYTYCVFLFFLNLTPSKDPIWPSHWEQIFSPSVRLKRCANDSKKDIHTVISVFSVSEITLYNPISTLENGRNVPEKNLKSRLTVYLLLLSYIPGLPAIIRFITGGFFAFKKQDICLQYLRYITWHIKCF